MKLEVPFYKQESKNDCGPTALQMVLEYLGENHSREKLMNLVDSDKNGITWTIGLAKTAAQLGFKTELYTASLEFDPKNYDLEFYKKESDGLPSTKEKLQTLKEEAYKLGVHM